MLKRSHNLSEKKNQDQHSWLKIQMESERYQPPRHGVILLQVCVGVLFFIFVVRFWYLQMYKGETFAKLAQENRYRQERILAPRGRILDANEQVLADNRTAYGLALVREDCFDIPATLAQISEWSGIPLPIIWEKYQGDRYKGKPFEPLLIITDIDFGLVAKIESDIHMWPGLKIVVRTKRNYPQRDLYANILGYVAEANEQEMEKDIALAMGDLIGKQGLELKLEKRLRGSKGLYDVEVDAHAHVLGKNMREHPRGGEEIHLAIDTNLQQAAWDALAGEFGSIVVIEPETGKIRALATTPAYDNNLFAAGISKRDWDALRTSKNFSMQNRAVQSSYPPGSVWKLLMASLFLEQGVNPAAGVFCPGQVKLGNQIFRCWKHSGHGTMNLENALVNSCDVYFYIMAERLGIDKISAYAKQSGFGQYTKIDLPNERTGLVPSKEWKKRHRNRVWVRGDTYNTSIGQGYTLVTPIQMAMYVAALLNGGDFLKPQLLNDAPREVVLSIPASEKTRKFVIEAMRKTAATGTAHVVARKDAIMGGKTGTAQVAKLKLTSGDRRVKNSELQYLQRDHAWIATWGKKGTRTFVVVVMVEHGGGGSSVAGPIAKKMYEHLFGPDANSPQAQTAAISTQVNQSERRTQ